MLNSFSSSSSSSRVDICNVGNTISLSPIVRTCTESKFKKVNINSKEFELMLSDNPRIVNETIEIAEDKDYCVEYKYSTQEIQILSFNPIQENIMLIEYIPIGQKQEKKISMYTNRYCKQKVFEQIFYTLVDMR